MTAGLVGFHAIICNIGQLYRVILGEEVKHMRDEEIINLYWNRNEQAIVETDQSYGKS